MDELGASDDFLLDAVEQGDVYSVKWKAKPSLQERVFSVMESLAERGLAGVWARGRLR